MGGKSPSSTSTTQTTTTRDERIAATDNATIIKDAFQNLTDINITDGGSFDVAKNSVDQNTRLALAVMQGAQKAVDTTIDASGMVIDRLAEFASAREEADKTSSDTVGASKLLPWLVAGVGTIALAGALKRGVKP